MSLKGRPFRDLGMKCQSNRSSLLKSKTALARCSGVSAARKLVAAAVISSAGECAEAAGTKRWKERASAERSFRQDFIRRNGDGSSKSHPAPSGTRETSYGNWME